MFSSQRSDLFSQDEYLTPATQQQQPAPAHAAAGAGAGAGGFLSHFAISSPSPIKKKSRSSRRGSGRAVALPTGGAIHEGDEEDAELDVDVPDVDHADAHGATMQLQQPQQLQQQKSKKPPLVPARAAAAVAVADDGSSSMEPSSTGSTACSSGSMGAGAAGDDSGFADFRNLGSQALTQSVVDGFGSLRMNGPSPEEDAGLMPMMRQQQHLPQHQHPHQYQQGPAAMQCSQDAALGFRLKSVGADWNLVDQDTGAGNPAPVSSGMHGGQGGAAGGGMGEAGEEMVQVVSIPPCNVNPFAARAGAGGGEGAGEGRKRHRQRKIKIPCRGGGGAGGGPAAISRYLMEFDQLETIGAGRFSLVYKVRKRLDGWVYAVKRSRHSLETEGEREVAMREVFALAALQGCPQLVRYLGAWMEEKHLYIQTEFCPGGSLERAVFPRGGAGAGGPAFGGAGAPYPPPAQQQQQQDGDGAASSGFDESEEALLRVARDAASALQFMHARGIVHMDVKPGNILLAGDGSFKLGDLGHAIKADGSMVVAEGDERYLSMDVLKGLDLFKLSAGAEVPDYQAILGPNDVFGLGASLYEVATRVPLASSGPEFRELREGHLRPLPGLSPGFQALLRDMLSPAAQDRPTAADVVRRAQALLGPAMVAAASSTNSSYSASSASSSATAAGPGNSSIAAAAAAVAAGAAQHHHHHHHHGSKGAGAGGMGAPAGALGAGAGGHKAGGTCSSPHCQEQQKRIKDLEEMVLSLTGLRG